MSTIMLAFQQDWTCNGVPGSSITLGQGGVLFVNDRVIDTSTKNRYKCIQVGTFDNVDTYNGCEFVLDVDDNNLLDTLADKGFEINTTRVWEIVSSPAFDTPRSPSATNDVKVVGIFSLTGGALTDSQVNGEIDSGSGYEQIASESVPALAGATLRTVYLTVPAGLSYQFTESGTVSIVSVKELKM